MCTYIPTQILLIKAAEMEKIVVVFIICYSILGLAHAQLKQGFYSPRCPTVESTIARVVEQHFRKDPSTTAALLRMHFHDCFVQGCDASILIDSTPSMSSEKDSPPNLTVRGYDLIDAAKKAVEAVCPNTVSCADIITLATRDAVALAGGPKYRYNVPTGRRDGLVSDANNVNLPGPDESISQAFASFRANGLTLNDMVALLGAHTVGVAHCDFFRDRLSDFQGSGKPDPTMDPGLAARLLKVCGKTPRSREPTAFLDQGTSFKVDNQFYNQTLFKRGIMTIDQELALDRSTRGMVMSFASNEAAFQKSFVDAMIKLSKTKVLVGKAGEIRKNCRVFNPKRRA